MGDKDSETPATDPAGGGRRQAGRREAQVPFAGPDRRKADRRAGTDRRTTPRSGDDGDAGDDSYDSG